MSTFTVKMAGYLTKVVGWLLQFYFKSGLARLWYKTYQFVWERNKRDQLRRFGDLGDLVKYMRDMKWRMDTWRELGDAISSPEAVQWRANHDPKGFIGDCDEFGTFLAAVLNNELADNPNWGGGATKPISHATLFTVLWYKFGGAESGGNRKGLGGHNVCLISYKDGTFAYMDYGWPQRSWATIEEVAEEVRKLYAVDYLPMGWMVSDPNTLKTILTDRT